MRAVSLTFAIAPTGTSDLPPCCPCQSGRLMVPGSSRSNQSTGHGCARGPFILKTTQNVLSPGGDCILQFTRRNRVFGKIFMTVWEQGEFLSATSSGYVIYSFLGPLPRADICRHNTWLCLSNFRKWILGGILALKNETLKCLYR